MAAFDSASAAVVAGVEIQQLLASTVPASPIRIGLATGDVVWDGDVCTGSRCVSPPNCWLARLPGQILVTNVVRWLAADASDNGFESFGSVEIDGITGPIEIFAVDWKTVRSGRRSPTQLTNRVCPYRRGSPRPCVNRWSAEKPNGACCTMHGIAPGTALARWC